MSDLPDRKYILALVATSTLPLSIEDVLADYGNGELKSRDEMDVRAAVEALQDVTLFTVYDGEMKSALDAAWGVADE